MDLENEVHSIWVIWTSNFQECKGRGRPESGRARVGHARVGVGQGRDMLGLGDRGSYTKVIGGKIESDQKGILIVCIVLPSPMYMF